MIIVTVHFLVMMFALLLACNDRVLGYPYPGGHGHNQWGGDQPRVGMMGGYQQQPQQGFGGGGAGNFGQGGGYARNRGGQQWQSGGGNGHGAEAYKMNVFNEPDRYGYDYTIPGATVHYLMHKKQGNQGSGNRGGSFGGWNNNY